MNRPFTRSARDSARRCSIRAGNSSLRSSGSPWSNGSTDTFGYHAVENRHYITDLQATILRQMGLDATDLEVEINGHPVRLIEEGEGPILPILT